MNRLWIRFSLVIVGAILLLVISLFASRLLLLASGPILETWPELQEKVPAGTMSQLRESARREAWAGITIFVGLSAAVSLVIGIWLSRGLTAPLSELESAAAAIEARDFGYRLPLRGSQELRAVAAAFNRMASELGQAEKLRNNLLADVAHELRGPLHLLQGNLQAMLDDVYPLEKEEIVRLFDQTCHLTTLVNDLHELAQAEAHQLPLNRQMTDMAQLVKDTADVFRPAAAAKNVALRVELLGTLSPLKADAARIRQTVHNLLNNALRHTPPGGRITVTVEQPADSMLVRVQDTGAGIAPEHLSHVFDRFYRTDSSRSRDQGGTGLGLAIVKAIAEAHGGQAAVASPGVGQGSTFTISLPT